MDSVVGPQTATDLQKLVGVDGVSIQGVDYPASAEGIGKLNPHHNLSVIDHRRFHSRPWWLRRPKNGKASHKISPSLSKDQARPF